jgi:hypothetical protein
MKEVSRPLQRHCRLGPFQGSLILNFSLEAMRRIMNAVPKAFGEGAVDNLLTQRKSCVLVRIFLGIIILELTVKFKKVCYPRRY